MTVDEVALLLGTAACFDYRTIGRTDVAAWHQALGHLALDDAQAAVVEHYRDKSDRVTPADIIGRVRASYAAPQTVAEVLDRDRALTVVDEQPSLYDGRPWRVAWDNPRPGTHLASKEHIAACMAEIDRVVGPAKARRRALAAAAAETFEQIEARATADPHPFDDAPSEVSG